MSTETGATTSETSLPNGGVDASTASAQTEDKAGAGEGQTVGAGELKKALELAETLKKEISSRDAKIAELQKASDAKKAQQLSLEEMNGKYKNLEIDNLRWRFAVENKVSKDLMQFITGESEEELSAKLQTLMGITQTMAKENLTNNHQKLSSLPVNPQQTQADLIKEIYESDK